MRYGLPEKTINNIIQVLSRNETIKRAVIFGSRSRGDHRYNSDIDLAVYTEEGLPPGLWLELDEAAGIYKIDVVDMACLNNERLRDRIIEQGSDIFQRQI